MEQNNQQPQAATPAKKSMSALGITGFVIGVIALATSFLPIINNFSAFLAVIGFVFALVGVIVTVRGTKGGKGLAIAGLVICVIAFAAVLATQSIYSTALNEASNAVNEAASGAKATSTTTTDSSKGDSKSSDSDASQQTDNLAVGTTVNMSDGLAVTVTAVETGLQDYSGDEFTRITVSYTNNGSKDATFNMYDWKGQDAQGAQRSSTYIVGGDSADSSARLASGTLTAGGTASGVLEFEGAITKAVYSPSLFSSQNNVTWVLA